MRLLDISEDFQSAVQGTKEIYINIDEINHIVLYQKNQDSRESYNIVLSLKNEKSFTSKLVYSKESEASEALTKIVERIRTWQNIES